MPNYYNPTDGPLVVDDEGRTIDGHAHADLKTTDQVKAHVDAGRLIQPSHVTKTSKPIPADEKTEA